VPTTLERHFQEIGKRRKKAEVVSLERVFTFLKKWRINRVRFMMTLEDIRNDKALVNSIDWSMTPEEAVTLYLEWGNNWTHGKHMVKSKKDVSYYFVVNTWDEPPKIYLVRRNSDEAVDLAAIDLPLHLRKRFLETVARRKSVYAITPEVREWLQKETDQAA
jgi:hypothetical protein